MIRALAAREEARSVARLCSAVEFERLASALTHLRLLGLLGTRLIALPGVVVPDTFIARVDWIVHAGRKDALHKQMLTWRLLQALEQRGIPAIPLKGPFMAERLHGDAGLRLSHDIDLLVAASQMTEAVAVIEEQGYVRPRVSDALPRLHHIFEADDAPPVELHWRISRYESTYSLEMLARSERRGNVMQPSPPDELISLLVFHARDGLVGLRHPVDVAAWWERYGNGAELSAAWQIIRSHPPLERPFAAGALAVERVLGVPVASGFPVRRRRGTAAAVSLLDWAEVRDDRQRDVATKVVDGLVTGPTGLFGWARRVIFPALPGSGWRRLRDQAMYAVALLVRSIPFYWLLLFPSGQRADRIDEGGSSRIELAEQARSRETEHGQRH